MVIQRLPLLISLITFFSFAFALPNFRRGVPYTPTTVPSLPTTPPLPGRPGPPDSPGSPGFPTPPGGDFEIFTIDNNFETAENDLPVIGTVGSLGVYNMLNWNMVCGDAALKRKAKLARDDLPTDPNLLGRQETGLISVTPHSPPNVAGWAARSELENGTPFISCNYETSIIDHFDLFIPEAPASFYYGCVSDPDSDVALPETCVISAIGYNRAGDVVARQQFEYVWEHGISQQMSPGNFDSTFTNLYTVEFQTNPPLLFGAVLDNVITKVYQRKE